MGRTSRKSNAAGGLQQFDRSPAGNASLSLTPIECGTGSQAAYPPGINLNPPTWLSRCVTVTPIAAVAAQS